MKNKKWISFITAIILVLSFSFTVFAISGQKSITVTYNNIKLMIDGKLFTLKDGSGNIVEPFTYNGTTYVPIRAVSEALNKKVGWNGATATVTIGGQTTTYLDTMNTYQYSTAYGQSFNESVGEKRLQDKVYDRSVKFHQQANSAVLKGGETEVTESSYLLNGEYLEFFATLVADRENGGNPSVMKIYGDNKLLYTSPGITTQTKPLDISLNVKGVNTLNIVIATPTPGDQAIRDIYLADARLTK